MHSITRLRLDEFRRRRNLLLIVRGLAAALLALLAAALICTAVDAWWILEPSSRWNMAALVYGLAAITMAGLVVAPWLKGKSPKYLADQLERVEPTLRERLVAAVELESESHRAKQLDSPVFREALQQSVARRIEAVDVRSVLPWKLIAIWTWLSLTALAILGLLCCLPSLYFPNRLGRVLLPMVDIGRVSRYAVEILEPTSQRETIPEDDVRLVKAKVHGGQPSRVYLEWTHNDRAPEQLAIPAPIENQKSKIENVFEVHWTPPIGTTRFRVVADGAVSAWHVFQTAPRPRVEGFDLEYKYPRYTELPNHVEHSDKGDIKALTGTLVSLSITTNLPKVGGELVLRPKDRSRVADHSDRRLQLVPNGEGKLTAELPIEFSAGYHVNLNSHDTGFTNSFSPKYEITALDDKAPMVRWKIPEQMSFPVKPNDILAMSVLIEDEVPVASVKQRIRAGQREWLEIDRELPAHAEDAVAFDFDILPLEVQPGEVVQTQVVVTDRKGLHGRTETIDLFVSSLTLDPKRQAALRQRTEVVAMIEDFEAQLKQQAETAAAARGKLEEEPSSEAAKQQAREAVEALSATTKREAARIRSSITSRLPETRDVVSSEEYELLARNLSRMENEDAVRLKDFADSLNTNRSAERSEDGQWKRLDEQVADVSNLARRARDFVGHDVLSQIGQDLKVLQSYQQQLVDNYEKIPPEQFRRRQALVARQMQDLATTLRENLPTLRNRGEKAGKQWLDWIESQASKILEVTGKPERVNSNQVSSAEGRRLADQVLKELRKHQNASSIDGQLASEQLKARDDLAGRSRTASQLLERIKSAVELTQDPGQRLEAEESLRQRDLPALEQLAAQREIQQSRNDGDHQFVADLGEAHRAAQSVVADRAADPEATKEKLERLRRSMDKLESIHSTQQAMKTLDQLFDGERWESGALPSQFEQPRIWEAFQQQMVNAAKDLRRAGVPVEKVAALEQALRGETLKRIGDKIDPRRYSSSPSASAADEIETLKDALREPLSNLGSVEAEARTALSELTPSVSRLARDAARQLEQSQRETQRLGESIAQGEVPDTEPRLKQLEQTLQANEPPMKQLREGLADLASRQNLMNEAGSRTARAADAAIALTHDAKKRLAESYEAVAASKSDPVAAPAALDDSAETQADVAKSLAKLADHFERLTESAEAPNDRPVEPLPPSAMPDLSEQLAKQPEMNQAHNEADRLRRLATLDPKRVLAELERELKRNQPMQAELSEISKEAASDALKTLEFSADQERELNVELENSDPAFLEKKEQLRAEVKRTAQAARKVAETLSPRVVTMAERSQQTEIAKRAQQLRDALNQSSEKADNVTTAEPFDEIFAAAKELYEGLDAYSRHTQRQSETFRAASNKTMTVDKNQLKAMQRQAEDLRSRFRDEDVRRAFDNERERIQETKAAEFANKRAEQQIEQREKALNEARKQLEKKPDQESAKQTVQRRADDLKAAEQDLATSRAKQEAAEQRQAAAKAAREAVQMRQSEPFETPNPSAELGGQVASDAADTARRIADELKQAVATALARPEATASSDAVENGIQDQAALQADVAKAAEALSRAARHEQRMTNATQADLLDKQASQVAELAKGSVGQAGEQLKSAAQSAAAGSQSKATTAATSQTKQALSAAESALRNQADALQQAVAGKGSSPSNASMNAERSSPSNSSNPLLSPQELARMLDELDTLLNMPSDGRSNESSKQNTKSSQASGQQRQSGKDGEPSSSSQSPSQSSQTLSEAAERLASEMNQQRQAMESSSQTMPATGAAESTSRSATQPGQSTAGFVPAVEVLNLEDWGKLREQSSEDAREGEREEIPAAYRQLIEEYFRRLSQRRK